MEKQSDPRDDPPRHTKPEWFRNTTWDDSVEQKFNQRLARARKWNRCQYLRIQAANLTHTFPEVSLRLLERYFEYPVNSQWSVAYATRAHALIAMNRLEEAISAFEDALAREREFPNSISQARHELPFFVAWYGMRNHYRRAIEVLEAIRSELVFPVDYFRWHAALAMIAEAQGDAPSARESAELAIRAAASRHSGFSRHPTVGLVTEHYGLVLEKLRSIVVSAPGKES